MKIIVEKCRSEYLQEFVEEIESVIRADFRTLDAVLAALCLSSWSESLCAADVDQEYLVKLSEWLKIRVREFESQSAR